MDLDKLTAEELGKLFPIRLENYKSEWPELYQQEKLLIVQTTGTENLVQIDHIGSTAIPGLMAKPTIDILLQISKNADVETLKSSFAKIGYQLTPQPENPPPHLTFVKGYSPKGFQGQSFHVHVRYKGMWNEILFRDYLRQCKLATDEYAQLKIKLASQYEFNREAYTNAKTGFIEKIIEKCRKYD